MDADERRSMRMNADLDFLREPAVTGRHLGCLVGAHDGATASAAVSHGMIMNRRPPWAQLAAATGTQRSR